jgi:hypothetical protein
MTHKQPWNIWRIKNRYIRAAFTLAIVTPILAATGTVVATIALCAGIGEGASYAHHVARTNSDVVGICRNYWRAITLKEAP